MYYILDAASILPVLALDVQEHHAVLDMCAAPGGKSVAISFLLGPKGTLTANEVSSSRRLRLKRVTDDYIPAHALAKIYITAHDAIHWHKFVT